MSELHKFLFDGLPVRGMIVRLTDTWQEILARRASNTATGAYPQPVAELLGEMTAAAALMQSNIKFQGSLILQVFGDGPVRVAVAEARPDLSLRATASVAEAVADGSGLQEMINARHKGRCAITLEPAERQPGQQPYQGVVPLVDGQQRPLADMAEVLEHYMRQSEQLETTLVLAANDKVAAGLLIQRLPLEGAGNLGAQGAPASHGIALEANHDPDEDYRRISILSKSLTREELLSLDVETVLRRLFWEEKLLRFPPQTGMLGPHFRCTCSRERVAQMIRGLGVQEAEGILAERGDVEVGCDFCGKQYRFDPVDVAQIFTAPGDQLPGSQTVQ
ncbi:Hsp33 family molecular chaperone HslO [Variovorax sp.]|uniref:Hsp33 family molecular chaperone HslO n=1 Tax=Variovorax sp. TaxID=1871043 RepID=UPI002D243ACB|nr:Hsp33 family molecular chaperone HslO [Variovorax sp.]HYP84031.1 Hsp33 family molecular chaperone HslO [Variovorax sp.]